MLDVPENVFIVFIRMQSLQKTYNRIRVIEGYVDIVHQHIHIVGFFNGILLFDIRFYLGRHYCDVNLYIFVLQSGVSVALLLHSPCYFSSVGFIFLIHE